MAKPKGTDMKAQPIALDGMTFDDRFRIGGAQYMETKTGRSFLDIADELASEKDKPRISTMAVVLTALYLQRNELVPVEQAEAIVAQLDLTQMMQVMARINLEIEEKNLSAPDVDLTETTATE